MLLACCSIIMAHPAGRTHAFFAYSCNTITASSATTYSKQEEEDVHAIVDGNIYWGEVA